MLAAEAKEVDELLGGDLSAFLETEAFEAKAGQAASFPVFGKAFKRLVVVGLGDKELDARTAGAAAAGAVKSLKGGSVGLTSADGLEPQDPGRGARGTWRQALLEGLLLGLHADKRFQGSKTPEKEKAPKGPEQLELLAWGSEGAMDQAKAMAAGVVFARELVNAPANIVDPLSLTAAAVDMAQRLGLTAKVMDEKAGGA